MAQHHLDSARTSLCGWGRGICTSPNCVVLGLHHNIVRGCSVRAGKKNTVSLRSFLTVWLDSARTTSPRNETPEPHWLLGIRNTTTYCRTTDKHHDTGQGEPALIVIQFMFYPQSQFLKRSVFWISFWGLHCYVTADVRGSALSPWTCLISTQAVHLWDKWI